MPVAVAEWAERLLLFFERGGPVLTAILVLSVVMWLLIVERYWHLYITHPRQVRQLTAQWRQRHDRSSWQARRIREGLIGEISQALNRSLTPIKGLTAVLPMLGLLGTVLGMVQTFDVLMVFGTGNVRGMTAGISEAMLTTMAGLVTALSGLYFSSHLEHQAQTETERVAGLLVYQ